MKWCSKFNGEFFEVKWEMVKKIKCEVLEVCWCSFKILVWEIYFSLKWVLYPSWLKNVCLFSHTLAPLLLSKWKWKNEAQGEKIGGNIGAWRPRGAQRSLRYWIKTLEINLRTLPLSPIDDPIQYLQEDNIFIFLHEIDLKTITCVIKIPRKRTP